MLQEIPQEEIIDDSHGKRMCERLIIDTERSAELEGYTPGIHSIFFLEHFAHKWFKHSIALLQFVGLDPNSIHTKAGIKSKPEPLVAYKRKLNQNPWKTLLEKCHYSKTML